MNATLDESELVKAAIDGDNTAFGELVKLNEKKIYSFAFGMLSNSDDAFDASQDTFMKAYRSIKLFKGESSFSTWLFAICRNCCYDLIKSNSKHKKQNVSLSEYEDDDDGTVIEIPDTSNAPEKIYERKRIREEIKKGIDSLPENHKEIVILRDLNGLSYEEIAKITGLNEGTVKSRINRARLKLQNYLKDKI